MLSQLVPVKFLTLGEALLSTFSLLPGIARFVDENAILTGRSSAH